MGVGAYGPPAENLVSLPRVADVGEPVAAGRYMRSAPDRDRENTRERLAVSGRVPGPASSQVPARESSAYRQSATRSDVLRSTAICVAVTADCL